MSKFEDLKAIVTLLKENCTFDVSVTNYNGKKPIDLLKQRLHEKNPYESNLPEVAKLEPFLREDGLNKSLDRKIQSRKKNY